MNLPAIRRQFEPSTNILLLDRAAYFEHGMVSSPFDERDVPLGGIFNDCIAFHGIVADNGVRRSILGSKDGAIEHVRAEGRKPVRHCACRGL